MWKWILGGLVVLVGGYWLLRRRALARGAAVPGREPLTTAKPVEKPSKFAGPGEGGGQYVKAPTYGTGTHVVADPAGIPSVLQPTAGAGIRDLQQGGDVKAAIIRTFGDAGVPDKTNTTRAAGVPTDSLSRIG